MKISTKQRFLRHVDMRGSSECWPWKATTSGGYGLFVLNASKLRRKQTTAHRCAYILFVEEITEEFDIHHRCENKLCVNPSHLQKVTTVEHVTELTPTSITYLNKRKTYCKNGHPFDERNTRFRIRNGRRVRECRKYSNIDRLKRYYGNRPRKKK